MRFLKSLIDSTPPKYAHFTTAHNVISSILAMQNKEHKTQNLDQSVRKVLQQRNIEMMLYLISDKMLGFKTG